ncbi:YHS domain-containing protein [Spirochaetota bacterium]
MKKLFLLSILMIFASSAFFLSACKKEMSHKQNKNAKVLDLITGQKKCAVGGEDINRAFYKVYKGKVVYFCCDGCKNRFDKEPEKYMEKLKGVNLPDAPSKM